MRGRQTATRNRPRPRVPAALTVSACLALSITTGCDSDSGTTPPSTPTISASPSQTPTPTATTTPTPKPPPPTLPPAAKGLTVESADAFTRFYLTLLDYAKLSRDLEPLRRWSDKGCIGCAELIDGYRQDFAAGGSYAGDFTFKKVVTTDIRLKQTKAAVVKFHATVGRHSFVPKPGAKPSAYPGEIVRWRVALAARGNQWITFEMEDEAG